MKLYLCKKCKNILLNLNEHCDGVTCCGEAVELLVPNTVEAAFEKHKPVIKEIDGLLYAVVGEVEHPMTEEHFIEFVIVDYGDHQRIHHLKPNDKPMVKLCQSQKPVDIYAYCNLHGLWAMDK